MFFQEDSAFAGVDVDEVGVGDALTVVLDGTVLAFVGAEGVAAGFVGDDFGEGLVGQLDHLFIGDDVDGAEGAVEVGGRADLLDGRDGLFVVAPEIEGGFVGIDGRGWRGGGGGAAPKKRRVPSLEKVRVAWSWMMKPGWKPGVVVETTSAALGSAVFQR